MTLRLLSSSTSKLSNSASFQRTLMLALGTSTASFSTSSTSASAFSYPRPVYIRSMGAFLPNDPVSNEEMETHIGCLDQESPAIGLMRDKILSLNGITSRHYAMVNEKPTHLNLDVASHSVQNALENSAGISLEDIGMLATGTTMPDVPIPGFANLLHGKLGTNHSVDCLSSAGICTSSTNALKAAVNAVAVGQHDKALVVGSETASHGLHARYLKRFLGKRDNPMSGMFLRYMLSDGAGCALLDTSPHPEQLSYRIDDFYHHSFAHRFPPCMVSGTTAGAGKPIDLDHIYKFNEDNMDVTLRVQQDIDLLKENVIPLGKEALQFAIDQKGFAAEGVDWVLPHMSSMMFYPEFAKQIHDVLGIEKDKIWTNLQSVGNVGAASMPLLLWGMLQNNPKVKMGDRVLVIVPESGNFSFHYILLTVV